MRIDLRLFGHVKVKRLKVECQADVSVYIKERSDFTEFDGATKEAARTAPWLFKAPGWPAVLEGSHVILGRIEELKEKVTEPGSLPAFLKKLEKLGALGGPFPLS